MMLPSNQGHISKTNKRIREEVFPVTSLQQDLSYVGYTWLNAAAQLMNHTRQSAKQGNMSDLKFACVCLTVQWHHTHVEGKIKWTDFTGPDHQTNAKVLPQWLPSKHVIYKQEFTSDWLIRSHGN